MAQTVYTIGYSGFAIDDFLLTLKTYGISAVIDVRSSPYSEYFSDYNREALESRLKRDGIHYRNYAKEFGARQEDPSYYSEEGYFDFEKYSQSEPFLNGIDRLCAGMKQGYTFALMCAEKEPFDCHRAILAARAFYEGGYQIIHICPDGRTFTQDDIHRHLLDRYYPDRNQFTLFGAEEDEAELLRKAYKKKNAEIGYRLEDNRPWNSLQ